MTDEAQYRLASRVAARGVRGPADSYVDRSNYDRCITRGVTGSILPVIYGNGTDIRNMLSAARADERAAVRE